MSKKPASNSLTAALGAVFTVSLANIPLASAADNPFGMQSLSSGYMVLAESKGGEGKCGEGKCGAGKGGEGMCGLSRMDANGDGKVTKSEYMKGQEGMFKSMDQNADGVIDKAEGEAHMKQMMNMMESMKSGKAGKAGEGKCGGSK